MVKLWVRQNHSFVEGRDHAMDALYILSWSVLFATAATAIKEMKGELDSRQLPSFFLSPKGRSYVRDFRILLLGCALALLGWGFMHLKVYLVLVNLAVAAIGSIILAAMVPWVWFLYLGGIVTAGITVYLWSRC